MPHGNAHLWTAVAYVIIGLPMVVAAFAVWWTHPINRAFIFGKYVTEDGVRYIMRRWPLMLLFGAFILCCAADHTVEWFYSHNRPELHGLLVFFSIVEAVISWATAVIFLFLGGRGAWRIWRKR